MKDLELEEVLIEPLLNDALFTSLINPST